MRLAGIGALVCYLLVAGCAKRYPVEGLVVALDPQRASMLVSHRPVPGLMPAMTMPFAVRNPAELEGLRPGSRVRFDLVVRKGSSYAAGVRGAQDAGELTADPEADSFPIPEPPEKIAPGEAMPDFELLSQHGTPLRLSDLRGRLVAVNFVYTRCPLPDVCPALAAKFARLQRRFADRMGEGLALVSITLDPQHDTPEVLARYARLWRAGPSWHFLTGSLEQVKTVAARFGLVFWVEDGVIAHTSQTVIIGRDGRLRAAIEGPGFHATELGDLIARLLEAP